MPKISKDQMVSKKKESELKQKPGGSNVGKYKGVSQKDMAGTAGGAPKGSFPINTKKRAISALAYARNAPDPEGVKSKVYKKYPSLKKK